jgi:hypothetical protein
VLNRLNFSYRREKFINPGVLKVAYDYENKTFVPELIIILRSSPRKCAVKIENFEKKNS